MNKDPAAPLEGPRPPHPSQARDEPRDGAVRARGGPLRGGRSGDLTLPARGLLFDSDGVLVDSHASVLGSWARWAEENDLDPVAVLAAVPGRRAADTAALFVEPAQVEESVALVTRYELDGADSTTAVPGVLDLLPQLDGVPWAVVTSGVRELATARLRGAGVPLARVLITAEDVTAGKPDPEGYASAAARLGLDPADVLVLEDSPSGIAAGQAAGSRVVGVGAGALSTTADVVVRDLSGARWTGAGLLLPAAAILRKPHGGD